MDKIIVVTGATGHIGVGLLHELRQRGEYVRAVVLENESYDYIKTLCDEIVFADVRQLNSLIKAFEGASSVFHLAGIITIGKENRSLLKTVNIEGTKNIIEACKKTQVKRLVYTSSVHAIKVLKDDVLMSEQLEFDAKSVVGDYAKSKAIATSFVMAANGKDLETVVCFPSGVINPYGFKRSNIGQLVLDYNNKKIPLYFNGAYNYVDVRDVAFGLAQAEKLGITGEGYILSGDILSIEDMLKILEYKTGIPRPKLKLPVGLFKILAPFAELHYKAHKLKPVFTSYSLYTLNVNSNFNYQKAQQELNFNPRPARQSLEDEIDFMLGTPPKK